MTPKKRGSRATDLKNARFGDGVLSSGKLIYAQGKINSVEKKRNITVERILSTTLAGFFWNRHFLQAKASFPACKQRGGDEATGYWLAAAEGRNATNSKN